MGFAIFASFDNQLGQMPLLFYGISYEKAVTIANDVGMSILATLEKAPDISTFKGESIIPIIEERAISYVYYFFLVSELIRPSFSFFLFAFELNQRDALYNNVTKISEAITPLMSMAKTDVVLKHPLMQNSSVSSLFKLEFENFFQKLPELIFKVPSQNTYGFQTNFVQSIACVFFSQPVEIEVIYADNIEQSEAFRLALRLTMGIFLKISQNKQNIVGEAILPIIESGKLAYSYFFQLPENKVGVLLVITDNANKIALYRWANVISDFFSRISPEIRSSVTLNALSKDVKRKLFSLYYFDALVNTYASRTHEKREYCEYEVSEFRKLVKFSDFHKLLYSLILGNEPIVFTGEPYDLISHFIMILQALTPHRDLELIKEQITSFVNLKKGKLYYSNQLKKIDYNKITIVDINKCRVYNKTSNAYTKKLSRDLKNKEFIDAKEYMKNQIQTLLDKVNQLVEYSQIEDSIKATKLIEYTIMNLPMPEMINIVKEMAIMYNPIIADLITAKAVYIFKSRIWS